MMDVSEAAEMERDFLDHAHRWWHNGNAFHHDWSACSGTATIRKRVDEAWAALPPAYCYARRAARDAERLRKALVAITAHEDAAGMDHVEVARAALEGPDR